MLVSGAARRRQRKLTPPPKAGSFPFCIQTRGLCFAAARVVIPPVNANTPSPANGDGVLAERTGLEPATSGVTGRRSNQLNYRSPCGWDAEARPFPGCRQFFFPGEAPASGAFG